MNLPKAGALLGGDLLCATSMVVTMIEPAFGRIREYPSGVRRWTLMLALSASWLPGSAIAQETVPATDQLSVPLQIVEVGSAAPLIRFNRYLSGGAHTHGAWNGGWQIPMALAAWAGDTSADSKLLQQIDYNLQGANSITANGGYPAQHELNVTGMYAVVRQSPRFWNEVLSQSQRDKITLVMKAALVSSAWATSDATHNVGPRVTLDGNWGGVGHDRYWNPNLREGYFGGLIQGMVFFGGRDAAEQILASYDHQNFVDELNAAGLTNTWETFNWKVLNPDQPNVPSGDLIQSRVRSYRFEGAPLRDPFELYEWLTLHTYGTGLTSGGRVNAGLNDGLGAVGTNGVLGGFLVSGQDALPNRDMVGMLREFDSADASGPRSSISYAYDGFRPNLANHLSVLVGGYWRPGPAAEEMLSRMDIGITDLVYKLEKGYRNFQHGKGTTSVFDLSMDGWNWSFRTTIPLWEQVIRPFHFRGSPPKAPIIESITKLRSDYDSSIIRVVPGSLKMLYRNLPTSASGDGSGEHTFLAKFVESSS
jgi:hypothetical protein